MRHYVDDPDNAGEKIDVIELLKRDRNKAPPPEGVLRYMRRDKWTRHEALLILAGYAPSNTVHNGMPLGVPGSGHVYLDGTTDWTLAEAGLQHPLETEFLFCYINLLDYSNGESMDERRTPNEWIAWAASKGISPHWLDYWRKQEDTDTGTGAEAMPVTTPAPAAQPDKIDHEAKLASLFDPVTVEVLEKTFPATGQWKKWAERASRNGLRDAAKQGRGQYNLYKAAVWFVGQGITGWDLARCYRVLASNLPARSFDDKYMLTGDMD